MAEVQIVHNRSPAKEEAGGKGRGGDRDYRPPVNSSEFLVSLVTGASRLKETGRGGGGVVIL